MGIFIHPYIKSLDNMGAYSDHKMQLITLINMHYTLDLHLYYG